MKPWYWCADDGTAMTAMVADDVQGEVGSGAACPACGVVMVGVKFRGKFVIGGDGATREFNHGCGWHPLPSKWAEVIDRGRSLDIVVAGGRVVKRIDGVEVRP